MARLHVPSLDSICVLIDRSLHDRAPNRCLPFDRIGARHPGVSILIKTRNRNKYHRGLCHTWANIRYKTSGLIRPHPMQPRTSLSPPLTLLLSISSCAYSGTAVVSLVAYSASSLPYPHPPAGAWLSPSSAIAAAHMIAGIHHRSIGLVSSTPAQTLLPKKVKFDRRSLQIVTGHPR